MKPQLKAMKSRIYIFAALAVLYPVACSGRLGGSGEKLSLRGLQQDQGIVGGNEFDGSALTYQYFAYMENADTGFRCGGSLLASPGTKNNILTSANCLRNVFGNDVTPPNVIVGYLNDMSAGNVFPVECVFEFPPFNYTTDGIPLYDYAVVRIAESADQTEGVYGFGNDTKPDADSPLRMIGLGATDASSNATSGVLKVFEPTFVPFDQCNTEYGGILVEDAHLCARGEEQGGQRTAACWSDEGGPLADEFALFGGLVEKVQVGIYSFSSSGCGQDDKPDVYSKTSNPVFLEWLEFFVFDPAFGQCPTPAPTTASPTSSAAPSIAPTTVAPTRTPTTAAPSTSTPTTLAPTGPPDSQEGGGGGCFDRIRTAVSGVSNQAASFVSGLFN